MDLIIGATNFHRPTPDGDLWPSHQGGAVSSSPTPAASNAVSPLTTGGGTYSRRVAQRSGQNSLKSLLKSSFNPLRVSLCVNLLLLVVLAFVYRPSSVIVSTGGGRRGGDALLLGSMAALPHHVQADGEGGGKSERGGRKSEENIDSMCRSHDEHSAKHLVGVVRQPCQVCGDGFRGHFLETLRSLNPKGTLEVSANPTSKKSRNEHQMIVGLEGQRGGGNDDDVVSRYPSLGADICGSTWGVPLSGILTSEHPIQPNLMIDSDEGFEIEDGRPHQRSRSSSVAVSTTAASFTKKSSAKKQHKGVTGSLDGGNAAADVVMVVGRRSASEPIFGSAISGDAGELNHFRVRRILRTRRILAGDTRSMKSMVDEDDVDRDVSDDDATIFISIGQFLDILCPSTIREIYDNARNPRRVFCGLVDQRWSGKGDNSATCYPYYMQRHCANGAFCPTDNIRLRTTRPEEGRGPTFGRFVAQLMYQGESYYGMIDSHSRFVPHWDTKMVMNIKMVPTEQGGKGVLSHYPGTFERYDQVLSFRRDHHLMTMCNAHYIASGIIRLDSQFMRTTGRLTEQPFAAAGFVFGDAAFLHHTPFDPHLYYIFDGEEVLYSVRLWTRGWNIYTPKEELLFHHYARHGAPRFWSLSNVNYAAAQKKGNNRVLHIMKSLKANTTSSQPLIDAITAKNMKLSQELNYYGLGSVRTLEEYRAYGSIDPVKWKVHNEVCAKISTERLLQYKHKYHKRQ